MSVSRCFRAMGYSPRSIPRKTCGGILSNGYPAILLGAGGRPLDAPARGSYYDTPPCVPCAMCPFFGAFVKMGFSCHLSGFLGVRKFGKRRIFGEKIQNNQKKFSE